MENNKQKAPLNMRALKGGSYSLVLCAAATVLLGLFSAPLIDFFRAVALGTL